MIGAENPILTIGRHDNMAPVRRAQIENLYLETLVLADEAQQIFADARDAMHLTTDPELSVAAFAEAMMTAARLTHILAWLLHQRAIIASEPSACLADSAMELADVAAADWSVVHRLDEPMRRVTAASERLYERINFLEDLWAEPLPVAPVQAMLADIALRL